MNNRNEWIFSKYKDVTQDVETMSKHLVMNMLNKTINMFEYKNLPETIPIKDFETILQVGGFAVVKEVNDKLYAFTAGLGGAPNEYYLPTIATISNPALNYTATLSIDKECVVVLNDYYYQGLLPMFSKYATFQANAEITLNYMLINHRIPSIAAAEDDNTRESLDNFFNDVKNGKVYHSVLTDGLIESLKSHKFIDDCYITECIEAIQYIKGSWYNEVGIKSAFNMKREAINEAETEMNDDILIPTIDTMLKCRKLGVEKINRMYKTDIQVELSSIWKQIREEIEIELETKKSEIEE